MAQARRIVLAARPEGAPGPEQFRMETVELPPPGPGQLRLRTIYLSLDPYMRGRMNAGRSYARPVEIGETMTGGVVAEVTDSRDDRFRPGDIVFAMAGWTTHANFDAAEARRIDPSLAPIVTALGVLGMPGLTAYVGLLEHGRPQPGETVVVSAAAGAVGQVVGQLARLKGCRVVGVAGAEDKIAWVRDELGFDAAVNYKAADFPERLAAACPDGVDVYFENVGGAVFDAVLPLMNDFGRAPVCGRIASYNAAGPEGPDRLAQTMGLVLTRRLTFRGFIVWDHADRAAEFEREMGAWVRQGRIKHREDVVEGFENTVEAFWGLLAGRNRGKLVVRVGEDPTRG